MRTHHSVEMSDDVFTDPDEAERPADANDRDASTDDWADVRMTEPEAGEWNVDAVVVDGRVEYVDLQIRPDLLAGFVGCLLDDVGAERAERILEAVADDRDLNVPSGARDE